MTTPAIHTVHVPVATVRKEPGFKAECTSECLYGERLTELDKHKGWLKVRSAVDGYEGYVNQNDVQNAENYASATHWVQTRSTLLFAKASIKSAVVHRLPFQSRLILSDRQDGPFTRTACGHYVWHAHMLRTDQIHQSDPLTLAHTHFIGAPYVWGGRSTEGLDCSGLIQALAAAKGLSIPRDSHEQEQSIQTRVTHTQAQAMDLVYWPGHVGILQSSTTLLHATAHSLGCVVEPYSDVLDRAGSVSSIRRLFE